METSLAWLAVAVFSIGANAWCARSLWKRRDLRLPTRIAGFAATLFAATCALSIFIGLVSSLSGVGGMSVDPSQRARIRAEASSESMNWIVFAVVVGIPGVISLVLASRRRIAAVRDD